VRYLVFGTGAVGGAVGGRLALAGNAVAFLAKPRVAEALQQHGLVLTGDGPGGRLDSPHIARSLDEAFSGAEPPEVVLLAVKAYDCEAAASALASLGGAAPPVVCLLNGIGNEATLAKGLGEDRVIAATLTTAVITPEPGVVQVTRERGLGLAAGHPLVPRLAQDLAAAGMRVRLHARADRMKWSKVLTNIVANATSAIIGWMPGDLFAHAGLYRLELEALREAVRVMQALGFAPEDLVGVPNRLLAFGLRLPPRFSQPFLGRAVATGRGTKRPSFHYDIGRGRSEVSWLNGAIVREGHPRGVPTPANEVLTDVMLDLVEGRAAPSQFQDQPYLLLQQAERAGVPGIRGYNRRAGAGPGGRARRQPPGMNPE
jgi:2-dehydropantoate 2-reductase